MHSWSYIIRTWPVAWVRLTAQDHDEISENSTAAVGADAYMYAHRKKPRESREPRDKAAPREATRRSARQGGHGPQELSEHEAAVAKLLIDGVCPQCGRVSGSIIHHPSLFILWVLTVC
jgi:hypothetical protein